MTRELFRDDSYLKTTTATLSGIENGALILDQTIFYPRGGGQPGDTGCIVRINGERLAVTDTTYSKDSGAILHHLEHVPSDLSIGETLALEIDWDRRYALMKLHTTLHLLCSVVDAPVTGGNIDENKARLDFALDDKPDPEALTAALNRLIGLDAPVTYTWISDEEMDAQPELVRTMSVKPPRGKGRVRLVEIEGTDLQPCGGTHVGRTGEIGAVEVTRIENRGKQNKRVIVKLA